MSQLSLPESLLSDDEDAPIMFTSKKQQQKDLDMLLRAVPTATDDETSLCSSYTPRCSLSTNSYFFAENKKSAKNEPPPKYQKDDVTPRHQRDIFLGKRRKNQTTHHFLTSMECSMVSAISDIKLRRDILEQDVHDFLKHNRNVQIWREVIDDGDCQYRNVTDDTYTIYTVVSKWLQNKQRRESLKGDILQLDAKENAKKRKRLSSSDARKATKKVLLDSSDTSFSSIGTPRQGDIILGQIKKNNATMAFLADVEARCDKQTHRRRNDVIEEVIHTWLSCYDDIKFWYLNRQDQSYRDISRDPGFISKYAAKWYSDRKHKYGKRWRYE